MSSKRNLLFSALSVGLFGVSSGAVAQNVITGGATLPQGLYQIILPAILAPGNVLIPFSYFPTASGTGKLAVLTNNGSLFGAAGRSVPMAGSDAVLTTSELTAYNATRNVPTNPARWGRILQFPSVATSLALPFNKTGTGGLNFPANAGGQVPDLCGVFSGRISDWSQITGSGRVGPIQVVYHNEGSGTSALLGNFLNAACPAEATTGTTPSKLTGGTFDAGQENFAAQFVGGVVPFNFVPAIGSPGMSTAIHAAAGRIGYISPDFVADLDDTMAVAQIKGFSPSQVNPALTLDTVLPPTGPAANTPAGWVPNFGNPANGYPIVGYTTFIVGQCFNGTDTHNTLPTMMAFLNKHYNATVNNDAQIVARDFIPLNAMWKTAIRQTFLTATSAQGIGNVSVCNAIGRPLL